MSEQLCYYCQKHFIATRIDRVGCTTVFNVDGKPEEVDVYWCGCDQKDAVVLAPITGDTLQDRQFLEDTAGDAEYNAYLDHIHTPSASEY